MPRIPTPRTRTRRASRATTIIWVVVGIVAAVAIFLVVSFATDASSFCATCHEMRPYYAAWQKGRHRDVACVQCHVNHGPVNRVLHKFEALKEVWAHATGDTAFPRREPPVVPDARCLRCHPQPGPKDPPPGFSHDLHRMEGPCQSCHARTGHNVTDAALKQAGIFSAANAAARAAQIPSGKVAAPGAGKADLPGHVSVACSNCHDMKQTKCSACHQRPTAKGHPQTGECATCHKPGKQWVFEHTTRADCRACHTPPANHFGNDCAKCHVPGTSFSNATFRHPAVPGGQHTYRSFACANCHPSGPPKVSCTCHGGGMPKGD